ncbi:MAG: 4Fe-4S dicluster domain-containing protein, partial [Candidatus Avispirillum sp.]
MQIETLGKKCTGCGACAASCPAKCIVMKPDGDGFLYPEVGDDCLGCERCTNVCPVISHKT